MINKVKTQNNVAIYCRLSREDGDDEESLSIYNQKASLTAYVKEKGWNIYDYYIDDGVSGTTFNRPGFNRLISDIERGNINIVITKDLSRFGRNYIYSGFFLEEFFPNNNIRFIAVQDCDSDKKDYDMVPFKNISNEWYARDCSRKIIYSIHSKAKRGDCVRTGIALYGYKYNEDNQRIPDPITAPIVKLIFEEIVKTRSPTYVINLLKEMKVVTPSYYAYLTTGYNKDKFCKYSEEESYIWTRKTIISIIKRREYIGDYVRCRYARKSYKDKRIIIKDDDEAFVFEKKFTPLISDELFYKANEVIKGNKEKFKAKIDNIYKNVVVCDNCLHSMSPQTRYEKKASNRLICHCSKCDYKVTVSIDLINEIIKREVLTLKRIILENENKFLDFINDYQNRKKKIDFNPSIEEENRLMKKLEDRYNKLSLFIQKLFESNVNEEIPMDTYNKMLKEYTTEQKSIENQLKLLEKTKEKENKIEVKQEGLKLLDNLKNLNQDEILTYEVIHTFFKQIRVHGDKNDKRKFVSKEKKFFIVYNYIDEATKEFLNNEFIVEEQ